MKHKFLHTLFCIVVSIVAMSVEASAQETATAQAQETAHPHSLGASWSYMGFNSTHSKNSDKKTFGTVGIKYEYRINQWVAVNGNLGWSHSWFGADADPTNAYPKKDNAILALAGCDVTWLHKGIVQLHSGVAGGVDIRVQENDRGTYTTAQLAGQFDALGLRLDWSRAYLDLSAGWGSMGCIRIGTGIKF